MGARKRLWTLEEWEREVAYGKAYEPHYTSLAPSSGIECPAASGLRGEPCRSHLFDLPFFTQHEGVKRRLVGCSTCGWTGHRAIGKTFGNGKGGAPVAGEA